MSYNEGVGKGKEKFNSRAILMQEGMTMLKLTSKVFLYIRKINQVCGLYVGLALRV